jgi:hypothetical protein
VLAEGSRWIHRRGHSPCTVRRSVYSEVVTYTVDFDDKTWTAMDEQTLNRDWRPMTDLEQIVYAKKGGGSVG